MSTGSGGDWARVGGGEGQVGGDRNGTTAVDKRELDWRGWEGGFRS